MKSITVAARCMAVTSLVVGLGLTGCDTPEDTADPVGDETPTAAQGIEPGGEAGGYRGLELVNPIPVPPFTLTETSGEPFDFLERTSGSLSFLFFGFTHCPDICPVQLANLAAALGDLNYAERTQIKVVFVSTDPERDSPDIVRAYLDRFDPAFIGLVAPTSAVNEVLVALDLPESTREDIPGTDNYNVGHIAQVMAITGDGMIRLAYPGGVRQSDWRNDLPALLRLNASVSGGTTPGG